MSKLHVLLIEDDVLLSEALAMLLEIGDCTVEAVYDGQQALDRLTGQPAELVLLDLHLPHVSGMEILQSLRERALWNETTVVVMTADTVRIHEVEGIADMALLKPVDPEELLELIARISSQIQQRREQNGRSRGIV